MFDTKLEEYGLDQVQGAEVEEKVQNRNYTYRAAILLVDGRRVPVTKRFGATEQKAKVIVEAIRDFVSHGRPEQALE